MKKALLFNLFLGVLFLSAQMVFGQPYITGLSLSASSVDETSDDILSVDFTNGPGVVGTAIAWYKDYAPLANLYLPFEAGSSNALLDFSGSGI